MAGSWLKLECKMLLLGWSSELPAAEYAAWIKLLQVTKAFGERGGRVKYSYFDDVLLSKLNLSRHAFDQIISKAIASNAIGRDGEYLVITHWADYQIDPTAAERKAKQRAQMPSDVTVTSVSHGCHDDRTGQDGTGQETKKRRSPKAKKKEERPPDFPEILDTPQFRETWAEWTGHRRETGKKQTPRAVGMQIKKLAGFGHDRAIAAIEHSIAGGYAGLFEPKGNGAKPQERILTDADHAAGW